MAGEAEAGSTGRRPSPHFFEGVPLKRFQTFSRLSAGRAFELMNPFSYMEVSFVKKICINLEKLSGAVDTLYHLSFQSETIRET